MANQMKEDEKNEKIIRGLLKLPANRRCINCNSLGPQYVCINFWTFVCTNCSGVHREFTHRVKSISMAKFTSPEISALQGGGNERAKEIYFKEWDQQRHSLPDSSNIRRLRDFIKHVYLDKMYTGEKSPDKNITMRMGNKTNLYEGKDTCQIGYGSPHYKDTVERNLTERFNSTKQPEDRRYKYNSNGRGSPRHGYRRSSVHFEVVDDRYRDDTSGKGRRSEERKFPIGEPKLEIKSSNHQKDLNKSRAPVIRSVRDILGDDVPPLCVTESPKANGGKNTSDSFHLEKNASSNSLGSSCEKSVVLKRENSGSLINFDIDPIPSYESTELLAQPKAAPSSQYITKSTSNNQSIDSNNRGSSDFNVEGNVLFSGQKPTNSPTLESLLFQLSTSVTTPIEPITSINSELVTTPKSTPNSTGELCGPPNNKTGSVSLKQNTERSLTIKLPEQTSQVSPLGNQVHSLFDIPIDNQSTTSKLNPSIGWAPSNQSSTLAQNAQGTSTTSFGQSSQIVSQDMSGETIESQLASRQTNFGERKALPEDLFTATYSSVSMSVPSWHAGPINSNSFGAQYPSEELKATTFHHSKSMNPFDLNDEPVLVTAPTMSSMATLQGALPNIEAHQGLLRTSSFGAPNAKWMASQPPSYGPAPQSPSYGVATESPSSYASTMSPNAYMGAQQVSRNMQGYGHADDCRIVGCHPSWDMRHQGFGGQGNEESFYMTLNKQQPPTSRSSLSTTLNSFASQGGNPFG